MKSESKPPRSPTEKESADKLAKSASPQTAKSTNKEQENAKARSRGDSPSAKNNAERSPRQENL